MCQRSKAIDIIAIFVLILSSLSWLTKADATIKDLYFLSGTPGTIRSVPVRSTLYRFDRASHSIVVVRQVVAENVGTDFIESSQDRRIIVVGSPHMQVTSLAVVDMNAPQVERIIPVGLSYTPERSIIRPYLLEIPAKGLYGALCLAEPDLKHWLVVRPLDSPGPQAARPETLSFDNLRYFRSDGSYGGGEGGRTVVAKPSTSIGLKGDIICGQSEPLDLRPPPQVEPDPHENLTLPVNTTDIAVLGRGHTDNRPFEPGIMYVLNKRLQMWRAVKIPGAFPWVRGFGFWVAGLAAEPDRDRERESPGKLRRMAAVLKKELRYDRRSPLSLIPGVLSRRVIPLQCRDGTHLQYSHRGGRQRSAPGC